MKKILKQLKETIKNNSQIITFIMILFLIGVVLGSLFMIFISKNDQKYVLSEITNFFKNIDNMYGINYFKQDLLNNQIQIILIYVLGLSMIGILAVIILMIFKGFLVGLTLSGIILNYKFKGVVGVVLYFFPIYFLKVLLFIFVSFFAVHTSLKFINAIIKKDELNFKTFLGKYFMSFIISTLSMITLSLLDSYLTPLLLKLFTFL